MKWPFEEIPAQEHAGMTKEVACRNDYFKFRHTGLRAGISSFPSYRKIRSIYPVSPKPPDSAEIVF